MYGHRQKLRKEVDCDGDGMVCTCVLYLPSSFHIFPSSLAVSAKDKSGLSVLICGVREKDRERVREKDREGVRTKERVGERES